LAARDRACSSAVAGFPRSERVIGNAASAIKATDHIAPIQPSELMSFLRNRCENKLPE
jgi:hypothetical protein